MKDQYKYPGQELAIFEKAVKWKSYFASYIQPFIGDDVLEVGGGIGGTTKLLNNGSSSKWTILEPDETMNRILNRKMGNDRNFSNCVIRPEAIIELKPGENFDTIIYIDVLEHIKNDSEEILKASAILRKNGHLIILSPAYNFLFSPFDKAIGHYRRYTSQSLKAVIPDQLKVIKVQYFDSIGFLASLANKLLLKQSYPSEKQVQIWDKLMVPVSKWTDKIFFHSFGKSILGVWKKE
jgi:2-polyprenyl-3-methyl-5-hydroxy-6-metoxy-1,4-benzoquinol methylase